jgi:hypothetical protein
MTNREMLEAIVNDAITEEVKEKAAEEIKKLDERNAKRAEKNAEKAAEKKPIMDSLLAHLTSEPTVAKDLAEVVGISTNQAVSLLNKMVKDEDEYKAVQVTDIKIPKVGKRKGFYLV